MGNLKVKMTDCLSVECLVEQKDETMAALMAEQKVDQWVQMMDCLSALRLV